MKIGLYTDSLGQLPLDQVLVEANELGLNCLEFGCANWSSVPHLNVDEMIENDLARQAFLSEIKNCGLAISALNCSGNPLNPGEGGKQHKEGVRKTIKLASLMNVERVVMMSGCPGGPGDKNANWITSAWPPENRKILQWQWDKVLIPYWRDLVNYTNKLGIHKLCLEMHSMQNVYNVETLVRLREAVGPTVGVNFDPSHLLWMGADPLAAIHQLGDAIYHAHAKDTRIDPINCGINSRIETKGFGRLFERSWNYVTLGYGNDERWWCDFVIALRGAGYDDVLSIEHEDAMMAPIEGIRKSVDLLNRVVTHEPGAWNPLLD